MNVDRLIYLVIVLAIVGFFMWFLVQLVNGEV